MVKFVHVRDLKNQTTALLREVETGTTLIQSWQEMDKAAKGDRYDLTRQ
jgi:hypothetical protein